MTATRIVYTTTTVGARRVTSGASGVGRVARAPMPEHHTMIEREGAGWSGPFTGDKVAEAMAFYGSDVTDVDCSVTCPACAVLAARGA